MKNKKILPAIIVTALVVVVAIIVVSVVLLRDPLPTEGVTLTEPADGTADIVLVNSNIKSFMALNNYRNEAVYQYCNGKENKYAPESVKFSWEGDSDGYTLYVATRSDFKDAVTYETKDTSMEVTGLKVGTEYFWRVVSEDGEKGSPKYTFTTAYNQPRTVVIDGVINSRDIGGYLTEDGKYQIKQGLVYRSANLRNLTPEGLSYMKEELGIKTELDVAGGEETSPLISEAGLNQEFHALTSYDNIFKDPAYNNAIRDAVKVFANKENYPVLFHCAIGRDRTGTLAATLLGLCGCSKETIYNEYFLTYFSEYGAYGDLEPKNLLYNIEGLYYGYKAYKNPKASLAENIEAYLLDIGVTKSEIKAIKDNLRECV